MGWCVLFGPWYFFCSVCGVRVRPRTCNSCSRDSPRLANRSQAKLATDGPGMSPKAFTACGRADGHSAHLSIHLTRGEALRQDTLRACCSIFLALSMKRWPDADRNSFLFAQLEALFIRGVVLLEPAQINREICLFWANRGCKSRSRLLPGWMGARRRGESRRCVQSEDRSRTIPETVHVQLSPLPNYPPHPHPIQHTS